LSNTSRRRGFSSCSAPSDELLCPGQYVNPSAVGAAELHLAGVALARGGAVVDDLDWIRLRPCSLEYVQQRLRRLRARDGETTVEQEERNAGRAHLGGLGFLLAHLTSELVTVEHTTGVGLGDTDITRQLHQHVAVADR